MCTCTAAHVQTVLYMYVYSVHVHVNTVYRPTQLCMYTYVPIALHMLVGLLRQYRALDLGHWKFALTNPSPSGLRVYQPQTSADLSLGCRHNRPTSRQNRPTSHGLYMHSILHTHVYTCMCTCKEHKELYSNLGV